MKQMVAESGVANAIVKVYTTITTQDIEVAFNRGSVYLPALIFGTKADLLGSKQNYEKLKEKYSPPVVQSEA